MTPERSQWVAFAAGSVAMLVLIAVVAGSPGLLEREDTHEPRAPESTATRESAATMGGSAVGQPGSPPQSTADLSRLAPPRLTAVVEAANRVTPSVVSVNVIRRRRVMPRSWLDQFFIPEGYEREVEGLGSGFVIADDGHIVTNAHVVQGATEIVVTTADGTDHPAELLGLDELSDVALLKVDARLPVPDFGDSDSLVTGEPAIAIGSPFGYLLSNAEPTVTSGVISGVGRHILPSAYGQARASGAQSIYADMIQTDASINPGNSGGALVNAEGRVIGVNSTIFSRSGGSQGLGFAIPINRALRIAEQLRTRGEVRRPWVGLEVEFAESRGRARGAVISKVTPGSPAARAGIRSGMELTAVAGRSVLSPLDWEAELLTAMPGESLTVSVREADGRQRQVRLAVEDLPSVQADRVEVVDGLELVSVTQAIRAERGLRSREGALIVGVSDEVTSVTGLRRGDVVVQINRWPVSNADDVAEVLEYMTGRGAIELYYERDGRYRRTIFRISDGG